MEETQGFGQNKENGRSVMGGGDEREDENHDNDDEQVVEVGDGAMMLGLDSGPHQEGNNDVLMMHAEAETEEQDQEGDDDDNDDDTDSDDNESLLMTLSNEERRWALEIKRAVEEGPHQQEGSSTAAADQLEPMDDMSYAVYALVTPPGRLEEALERIRGIQQFQKTYGVDHTDIEQGVSIVQEFMRLQPLALLYLDVIQETSEGIIVFNMAKYFPAMAHQVSPTQPLDPYQNYWRIHLLFGYYLLRCVQPTFQSIRLGVILLLEAANVTWRNLDQSLLRQQNDEWLRHYPVLPQSIRVYNTNYAVTVYRALIQSCLPTPITRAIRMGCIVDNDIAPTTATTRTNESSDRPLPPPPPPPPIYTLCDLYLQPDTEEATTRLLGRVREMLTRRLQNERTFTL